MPCWFIAKPHFKFNHQPYDSGMSCPKISQYTNQKGVGLIEVLVALLLLAIAVMGYGALHINAVKLTDNANKTTHALLAFQNLTEQVRQTPQALPVYQKMFSQLSSLGTNTQPSFGCGLMANQKSSFCNPTQLAQVNAYLIWQQLNEVGVDINMVNCTKQHNQGVSAHCVVMAWGATKPIIGNNASQDCMFLSSTDQAVFYPKAQCLMLAVQ